MAEFLNGALRANETIEKLTTLAGDQRKRVSSIPVSRGFTTTPDGRVLDRLGKIIYTPTREEKKKP